MQYDEGEVFTAGVYLGECPAGDGRLNVTYSVVRVGELLYHAGCSPTRLRVGACAICHMPVTSGIFCAADYKVGMAFILFLAGLRGRYLNPVRWHANEYTPDTTEAQDVRLQRTTARLFPEGVTR